MGLASIRGQSWCRAPAPALRPRFSKFVYSSSLAAGNSTSTLPHMTVRVMSLAAVLLAGVAAFAAEAPPARKQIRINLDELPKDRAPARTPATPATTPRPATATAPQPTAPAVVTPTAPPRPLPVAPAEGEKIKGIEVERHDGRGFLGVDLENNAFKISFYDAEKKPVPADVARVAARWNVTYQPAPERTLLTPTADGMALASLKIVRPPHQFRLFLTLLNAAADGSDQVVETHMVEFVR